MESLVTRPPSRRDAVKKPKWQMVEPVMLQCDAGYGRKVKAVFVPSEQAWTNLRYPGIAVTYDSLVWSITHIHSGFALHLGRFLGRAGAIKAVELFVVPPAIFDKPVGEVIEDPECKKIRNEISVHLGYAEI